MVGNLVQDLAVILLHGWECLCGHIVLLQEVLKLESDLAHGDAFGVALVHVGLELVLLAEQAQLAQLFAFSLLASLL
jgi:hypothetical protein